MRLASCLTIICLMQILLNAVATKGKYTVIAPGTIHCNEKYTAAVALHHTSQPCKIKLGITGPSYNDSKQVEFAQNEIKHVEFLLPCLENGDYNLTAEGIDCLDNFQNTTKLIYKKFNYHVRIQTNKDFYEPGDDINFRVLFLDKDLRPARPGKDAVIWFEDGKHNQVKEIKDIKTIKGVYTGKLKISEFPVTGIWYLVVRNDGGFDNVVNFEVSKVVSPKFVVRVEAPKSVSVKDGELQVVVRAHYNYGKPLEGNVTVTLFLEYFNNFRGIEPPTQNKTAEMVKGKAKLDFNVKEYDAYLTYENSPYYATIVAKVEEKFTGVEITETASTIIYPYRYTINCINYDAFAKFAVDKKNEVLFHVTYIDGSYLNDTTSSVELIYKEVLRENHWWHGTRALDKDSLVPQLSENHAVIFKGHMNETGFVNFTVSLFDLPQYEGYLHYYALELKYLDEQHEICDTHLYWDQKQVNSPKKEEENPKEYFTLEDKYGSDKKLYLKRDSEFALNSSQPLPYFDYNVIGRGNILESGRIELLDKPKVYNLTLTPQFSWAPSFCVYVNYVDANGEYHYAEQHYEVVLELENQINITAAKRVKPGEEVTFRIQTAPNSFVGLMAVDQSTFILRHNYDLNFNEMNRVLGTYHTYTAPHDGYSIYPGEMSGCVTFTNADYFYGRTWTKKKKRDLFFSGTKSASRYGSAAGISDATNMKSPNGVLQTWLFANIENTEASEFTWTTKIPETISSWVLEAFSLNPQKGLGVTKEKTTITTFLPFFISIRLPYSIKRGEIINVPAFVFNYLDKSLDVKITLHNSDDEYEFIEFDNEVIDEQKVSKSTNIPAYEGAGVSFLLKPKVVGNVMLKFTATSSVAGDVIHKTMRVVPEGITQYANRAFFVNLNTESEFKASFLLELPQHIVPESAHIEVGFMGDILGPVLNNLDNLLRLPTGCVEQAMSTLLTNYLVMKYLKDSKRLTAAMEEKLRYKLETGYQNILSYRRTDGSFSSFGLTDSIKKPRNGSTWLTAYVIRSLQQIKNVISIDGKIIEEGIDYLSKQQVANGIFTEKGDYFFASQVNHMTLTGAVVLAIMENPTYAKKYHEELSKSLYFIAQNMGKLNSLHAQAIGAFTLNKAKYITAKDEIFKLKDLAKTESDRMWWSAEKQCFGDKWWYYDFSDDVEITSYVLLTLLDQESTKVDDLLPIINWLVAQRNNLGGFASTQDTVLGLTALIEFAKFTKYESAKMRVDIESKEIKETIKVTEDNGILYQYIQMSPKTRPIEITATGTGLGLVQIAYQYNVFENDPKPSFTINTTNIRNNNNPLNLQILVCVNYVGEGESSNMAVMEISTPSGYVIEDESINEHNELQRSTELKYSNTLLIVYFDHLYKNDETCFLVEVVRTHHVAMQKPVPIVLYDYYNTSKRATAFYGVESKLCDICETKEECSKCKY